ncbi:MAG: STAS domain-containing protein [Ramlibacter sp.]
MNQDSSALHALLVPAIAKEWIQEGGGTLTEGARRSMEADATELVNALRSGLEQDGDVKSLQAPAWEALRDALEALSSTRVAQGQTAAATSAFVLALKRPLFAVLQRGANPAAAISTMWSLSLLVDNMAQWTVSAYQHTREDVIKRQQQELLELSTPVIKLWDGVLAVPMIGTLDSERTQLVMETLLQRIVEAGAQLAIIDITGVPTVDTLVAQHLLKTVSAIRLMGAECIISGIRPQIAQTIVHLGIDLQGIATKSSLADALSLALQQTGYRISRVEP